MRICLVSHSLPPTIGGGETHLYLIAKALHDRGHEVTVIAGGDHWDQGNVDLFPFRVLRVPAFREFEMGTASLRQFLPGLHQAITRHGFDVIHVHNFMPGLAFAVVAPILGAKKIFTFHSTPVPREGKILGHFPNWDLEQAFARFVLRLRFYQVLVCPSRYYYRWALELGVPRKKLRLVYHGIDAERFRVRPDPSWRQERGFEQDDFIVICAARMVERKGILDAIRAIQILRDEKVKLYVSTSVVSGSSSYWERVRSFVQDNELWHRVRIEADVHTAFDMPRVLANCDALILPSHVEGLGVILLEGMAAKLPVLGSSTHGITEVIRDGRNGLLFEPEDPQDIAEKMRRITTDKELANRLAAEGRKHVEGKFSLTRQVRQLELIYGTP